MFFTQVLSLQSSEIAHGRETVFLFRVREMLCEKIRTCHTSEVSHKGKAVFLW
ncbi:unnamed protein product [Staurois parvus]|uniref:Uncharacterized protein n=1 Tax=Staurois parvus TaxID=386267 RepID=A0ABN9DVM5_9NEOB|nr:unnamed protein product [Staurois parvus]